MGAVYAADHDICCHIRYHEMVKTALVLSAGGMFGAYQAGVWKALEPVLRPDVVLGCSAGSINGWAIASGISGAGTHSTVAGPALRQADDAAPAGAAMARLFRSRSDRGDGPGIDRDLHAPGAVCLVGHPPAPIAPRTGQHARHHVAAYRGSCAIPVAFPPVRVGSRSYCDGGLLSVIPTWAVPQFGVERAIAVNVLPSCR